MENLLVFALAVTGISLLAWMWLVLGRGFFWKMDQSLRIQNYPNAASEDLWPSVKIIVPARNEAETLPTTLTPEQKTKGCIISKRSWRHLSLGKSSARKI